MSDSVSIVARGTTAVSVLDGRGNETAITLLNNARVEVQVVGGAPGPRGLDGSGVADPGDLILYFQNGLT